MTTSHLHLAKQEAIQLFSKHISSAKAEFFTSVGIDFVLGKREGPYLWDLAGEKRLIDCHCNGGVFNLGHRNPEIIGALRKALDEVDIGNHHLLSEPRARLAKKFADLMPADINYTVFGVSGGEATDLAIKVARSFTKRSGIISAQGGYHGHTGLALAAGDPKFRDTFRIDTHDFTQVPFNDVAALRKAVDGKTAAVILETIPATFGMLQPVAGYLAAVREICDAAGALLILDEVQAGLGRTGKLWGFEHFDVVPDIVVLGKGLSGGIYPMSATCLRAPLEAVFHEDPFIHISTFGGSELGCAVTTTVLDIASNPVFLANVNTIAAMFKDAFVEFKKRYPGILIGLRQRGLMMGIEMSQEMCGPVFTKAAYDNGLLSVYSGNDRRVAQLMPPLNIDKALAQEIIDRLDKTLAAVNAVFAG